MVGEMELRLSAAIQNLMPVEAELFVPALGCALWIGHRQSTLQLRL